jgi:hypothetical protein
VLLSSTSVDKVTAIGLAIGASDAQTVPLHFDGSSSHP